MGEESEEAQEEHGMQRIASEQGKAKRRALQDFTKMFERWLGGFGANKPDVGADWEEKKK